MVDEDCTRTDRKKHICTRSKPMPSPALLVLATVRRCYLGSAIRNGPCHYPIHLLVGFRNRSDLHVPDQSFRPVWTPAGVVIFYRKAICSPGVQNTAVL